MGKPVMVSRRTLISGTSFLGIASFITLANAKLIKDFNQVQDRQDRYQYLYPLGWQQVSVDGQDSVFKDIIEPLENVTVSVTPTEKGSIDDFGAINDVAAPLAKEVLSNPGQETQLVSTNTRTKRGKLYYELEFTSKSSNYVRHALTIAVVTNGKFYILTTGSNQTDGLKWNNGSEQSSNLSRSNHDQFEASTSRIELNTLKTG